MYAVQSFHPGKGAARRNPYEPQMIITFIPMMSVWKLLTTAVYTFKNAMACTRSRILRHHYDFCG